VNNVADIGITPGSPSWLRLARFAKLLSSLTLVWLGIEGVIGVVAGIVAGSIALVAFGLDSTIEGLASVIVIWRFTGSRTVSVDAERRAQRWAGEGRPGFPSRTIDMGALDRPRHQRANFGVSDRRFRFKPAGGFGGNRQALGRWLKYGEER
jgi:hypothetical protein